MATIVGQKQLITEVSRIIEIFKNSECVIRPHFVLTGPSGSGKTITIETLAKKFGLGYFEINAAQLTKEGTSGNSLSKALTPLMQIAGKPSICFVDEFDKLFISGNSNDNLAHESTNGVQNEFLKVLESDTTQVFGDYGKYVGCSVKNVLFIFAGAFNNEEDITLDRLRDFGVKTEFLGRVGLVYNTQALKLEDLYKIIDESSLLTHYCKLFVDTNREKVVAELKEHVRENYEMNTLGARMISTMINQYFIKGGLKKEEAKSISFQKKMTLNDPEA
jgi:ATP-dependent protease Clp ATPase subunit